MKFKIKKNGKKYLLKPTFSVLLAMVLLLVVLVLSLCSNLILKLILLSEISYLEAANNKLQYPAKLSSGSSQA